jgi:hypothetical protein
MTHEHTAMTEGSSYFDLFYRTIPNCFKVTEENCENVSANYQITGI